MPVRTADPLDLTEKFLAIFQCVCVYVCFDSSQARFEAENPRFFERRPRRSMKKLISQHGKQKFFPAPKYPPLGDVLQRFILSSFGSLLLPISLYAAPCL